MIKKHNPTVIQFGIPTIDDLLGRRSAGASDKKDGLPDGTYPLSSYGIHLPILGEDKTRASSQDDKKPRPRAATTSVCIVGPDGAGKSVLAMHLASRYAADCIGYEPKIVYASTDLSYQQALGTWSAFGLDIPNLRKIPFLDKEKPAHWTTPIENGEAVPNGIVVDLQEFRYQQSETSSVDNTELSNPPISSYLISPHPSKRAGDKTPEVKHVAFLNLQESTAGDDWGFLNRIVALLGEPAVDSEDKTRCEPANLLIIDAVEGLETLVGDVDSYGQLRSRRSRIAQIIRMAAPVCHLVLIVEEPKADERLPEEFVTDVVIRLRSVPVNNYERRTIEIEKARGQAHTRGQHPIQIRDGRGSTTGTGVNYDDPRVLSAKDINAAPAGDNPENSEVTQAYFHVTHSLHYLNRHVMRIQREQRSDLPLDKFAGFGIEYLDDMLASGIGGEITSRDRQGLPCSTVTALIGDDATQKSSLGRAFLGHPFRHYADLLANFLILVKEPSNEKEPALIHRRAAMESIIAKLPLEAEENSAPDVKKAVEALKELKGHLSKAYKIKEIPKWAKEHIFSREVPECTVLRLETELKKNRSELKKEIYVLQAVGFLKELLRLDKNEGVSIFLTASDHHALGLAETFTDNITRDAPLKDDLKEAGLFDAYKSALQEYIENHTICRRLEIHDLSSPVLAHIIRRAVNQAQQIIFQDLYAGAYGNKVPLDTNERFKESWRIRLVIEDLRTIRDTYPDVRNDPLFLPFLIFDLCREGVTTLIIDTQPGRPDTPITERFDSELRALVHHHLLTWRVQFFGESCVAIAAIPPISKLTPAVVRELKHGPDKDLDTLIVDPHFELYMGVDENKPALVPLKVRFFGETPAFHEYAKQVNQLFGDLFARVDGSDHIVTCESDPTGDQNTILNYDTLREFSYLQRDTRFNHTLVFQVDEFWALDHSVGLRDQFCYLNARTVKPKSAKGGVVKDNIVDPFGLFQPTRHGDDKASASQFTMGDIKNFPSLIDRLKARRKDEVSRFVYSQFFKDILHNVPITAEIPDELKKKLISALNKILDSQELYNRERFRPFEVSVEAQSITKIIDPEDTQQTENNASVNHRPAPNPQKLQGARLTRLNRLLLEAAYPNEIRESQNYGSKRYHFFETALIGIQSPFDLALDRSDKEKRKVTTVDRVPFAWNFSFLLCRKKAWMAAYHEELSVMSKGMTPKGALLPDAFKPPTDSSPSNNFSPPKAGSTAYYVNCELEAICKKEVEEAAVLAMQAEQVKNDVVRKAGESVRDNAVLAFDVSQPEADLELTVDDATSAAAQAVLNVQRAVTENERCTVRHVWNALRSASSLPSKIDFLDGPNRGGLLSWRTFLEACCVVAKTQAIRESGPVSAFDLSTQSSESLSCLVLEIWASEIRKKQEGNLKSDFESALNTREWEPKAEHSLIDWLVEKDENNEDLPLRDLYDPEKHPSAPNLNKYSLELFKTFKLLGEVLKANELLDPDRVFTVANRSPDPSAVAARHWYTTACQLSHQFDAGDPLIPLALPGSFSARGDWFLAVASGSRSTRLGDRALDLLSSRRANITRLQMGVGLPTRDVVGEAGYDELRTGLFTVKEQALPQTPSNNPYIIDDVKVSLTYEELLKIGPRETDQDFHWLWRSRLKHYDRHARIWQKWICRILTENAKMREKLVGEYRWNSGFQVYDWLEMENPPVNVRGFRTFKEFGKLCDFLIAELRKASPREDESD